MNGIGYVVARDRFLKPGGKMYPSSGSIILAPIADEQLFQEQISKIQFWNTTNFYGLDLTPAVELAYNEYFSQPVVGKPSQYLFDYLACLIDVYF
jgi:type I protein arginine methyltransferase